MKSNNAGSKVRKVCRFLHRDLSFFFAGMIMIYAISGFVMNHRRTFNPNYSISRTEMQLTESAKYHAGMTRAEVEGMLTALGIEVPYVKHYYPNEGQMKVFLKGGSSLEVDGTAGMAVFEKLTPRPVLRALTRLHYNPGRWWTWFSDAFAISLLIITISGLIMLKGPKGFWGRGGIEFAIGILIPLLFLFL